MLKSTSAKQKVQTKFELKKVLIKGIFMQVQTTNYIEKYQVNQIVNEMLRIGELN